MINLKNRKILVTGATGGIGGAIIKKFVELDAKVLATGTNNEKLYDLKKKYSNIQTLNFNINNHEKIEDFIEQVHSELDGLDVLVNNAGVTVDNLSLRMKHEEWQKVIDINLTSTFYLCKYSLKKMLKKNMVGL